MKIIGLAGYKNSGKDLAYKFLAEHQYRTRRVSFADNMKLSMARGFGWGGTDEQKIEHINRIKENGRIEAHWDYGGYMCQSVSGRDFLINLGQGLRHTLGSDVWLDAVLPPWSAPQLAMKYPETDLLVVTDVRFAHEAERIKGVGGRVWRINRMPKHQIPKDDFYVPDRHIDREIENYGSRTELKAKIGIALEVYSG